MHTAKIFTNGRSQAVRLPRQFRFDDDQVFITRIDDLVILYPRRKGWDLLARGLAAFTEDFLIARNQPADADGREDL